MAMPTASPEKVSTNQGMGVVDLGCTAMVPFQTDVLNPRVVLSNVHSGTATGHTGHASNTALVVTHAGKINRKRQINKLTNQLGEKESPLQSGNKGEFIFCYCWFSKRVRRAAKGHF